MTSTDKFPLGRIGPRAFDISTSIIFASAIIAYLFRLYIQLIIYKRFPAEDRVLLFAVVVLVGDTTLGYILFLEFAKVFEVSLTMSNTDAFPIIVQALPKASKEGIATSILWCFILFPVKLAYLLFFRKLISRLKRLSQYWWFVTGFTVVALVASLTANSQICLHTSVEDIVFKCTGTAEGDRNQKVAIATGIFDVISDILIASIPICLLWRVRISLRQKIGLGITLCLSLVMAIIALVRVGGLRLPRGQVDVIWFSYWNQNECNIAVWMVSVTSFRSFFIAGGEYSHEDGRVGWIVSMRRSLKRTLHKLFPNFVGNNPGEYSGSPYERSNRSDRPMIESHDPAIPGATVTGMQTAIQRAGGTQMEPDEASV